MPHLTTVICHRCVRCSTCEHSSEPGSIEVHCHCKRFDCETCGRGGIEFDQCPDCDDGFEEMCDDCIEEQEYEERMSQIESAEHRWESEKDRWQ